MSAAAAAFPESSHSGARHAHVFGATDCQGQGKTVTRFRAPFGDI
jgi:hypothetical protein